MSYGFKMINTNGETVIDADYRNHSVFANGSIALANYSANAAQINFAARADYPILAVQPGPVWVGGAWILNTKDKAGFYGSAFGAGSVNWALSDLDGALADVATYGMRVFDAAGKPAFDSRKRYMKIRDVVRVATPPWGTTYTVNHASVPNAYYILSAFGGLTGFYLPPGSPFGLDAATLMLRQINSSQIEFAWKVHLYITHESNTEPPHQDTFPPFSTIIVCELSL